MVTYPTVVYYILFTAHRGASQRSFQELHSCQATQRRPTCITFALRANPVTQRTDQTQSILWKDIVRGSQITAVLKDGQIKKGNEKTSAGEVILRYQHLGFRVLFDSSGSTLRQWLPMAADSRRQLPLYNATQHCY